MNLLNIENMQVGIFSGIIPQKHGIILKVHRKELLELHTQLKFWHYRLQAVRYFSDITQLYGFLLTDLKKICQCNIFCKVLMDFSQLSKSVTNH